MSDYRILIVEDSQTQLERLRFLLEEGGFSVLAAANGKDGLAAARANAVDLVLSDIVMPDMDGHDLCRAVNKDPALRPVPVLLLTALNDPRDVMRALEGGAAGFVRKPYNDQDLLRRIGDVLAVRETRRSAAEETGPSEAIDVTFQGESYSITADRVQILDILLYTFSDVAGRNEELIRAQEELRAVNATLEERVGRRTAELTVEVADRKRAEQAVRDQLEELTRQEDTIRQQQRMETVGQLAAGIAHDFNNLLTGISGFTRLAHDALPEESSPREDLDEVLALAERAAVLTRQLLSFSRRQAMRAVAVDLNGLVDGLLKSLGRLIGEHIRIVSVPTSDLAAVSGDPGLIEQVLMNLAVNARDAMQAGGTLTIETANAELDQEWADAHPGAKPGRYAMLAVSDTGCGMTESVRAHMFEPFFTTKEVGEGTGLGLATVYGIVMQHEGSVWAYSEPGSGSTFRVYLPVVPGGEIPALPRGAEPAVPVGGGETVLVVEDEGAVRSFIERVLRRQGYHVLTVASGEQALALLCAGSEIDLLLTDVVMPGMAGPKLVETVLEMTPEVRVLYMSGYTRNAIFHGGHAGRDIDLIEKPFTSTALVQRVREALDAAKSNGALG